MSTGKRLRCDKNVYEITHNSEYEKQTSSPTSYVVLEVRSCLHHLFHIEETVDVLL
jgi:hypothetical protein